MKGIIKIKTDGKTNCRSAIAKKSEESIGYLPIIDK